MYGTGHLSSVFKVTAFANAPIYRLLDLYQPKHR
jgi:hypothetical protein